MNELLDKDAFYGRGLSAVAEESQLKVPTWRNPIGELRTAKAEADSAATQVESARTVDSGNSA